MHRLHQDRCPGITRSYKVGMAHCPRDPPATFKSMTFERQCDHFKLATEEKKEARRESWRLLMNPAPKPKTEGDENGS